MKTCATCRFMAAKRGSVLYTDSPDPDDFDWKESEHRTCTRVLHGNGSYDRDTHVERHPALVVDGSGYAARLVVLPTFGCNLHEDK